MSAAAKLWLVRHGETAWSRAGRHTGRTDVPLTPAGEHEARAIGAVLGGLRPALVLTSPLERARRTCELAGLGAPAEVDRDLAEWDYGEYEGRTTAEVRAERPGWTIWSGDPPGGEPLAAVATRADRVIARAEAAHGEVVLFAHAHVLRILTARWLGLEPRDGRLFALDAGSISVLGYEHGSRAMVRWNQRTAAAGP